MFLFSLNENLKVPFLQAFNTKVRPLLQAANPNAGNKRVILAMTALWQEFQEYTKKKKGVGGSILKATPSGSGPGTPSTTDKDSSAASGKDLKIKIKLNTAARGSTGRKRKKAGAGSSVRILKMHILRLIFFIISCVF